MTLDRELAYDHGALPIEEATRNIVAAWELGDEEAAATHLGRASEILRLVGLAIAELRDEDRHSEADAMFEGLVDASRAMNEETAALSGYNPMILRLLYLSGAAPEDPHA
jgi:hypothetical protein